MSSPWQQIRSLTTAELRIEARSGHTLWTTLPYAVTALLVIALAVGADIPLLRRIGIGTYWSTVLVFGALACSRQSTTNRSARPELLVLLGIDPAVRYLSWALASSLVVLLFALLPAPAAVVLYDVAIDRAVPSGSRSCSSLQGSARWARWRPT